MVAPSFCYAHQTIRDGALLTPRERDDVGTIPRRQLTLRTIK